MNKRSNAGPARSGRADMSESERKMTDKISDWRTSPDHTVWLCGGSGKLSDESKAELAMFAGYLRLGGKRVFGSYAEYAAACEREASEGR